MIITLLRKPLEGRVADNTLKHGCGAINIDATRISTSDNLNGGAYAENPTERGGQDMWTSTRKGDSNCFRRGGAGDYEQPTGRWPANFILTHLDACELRGTKKVKSDGHWTQKANIGKFYEGGWSHQEIDEGNKMSDEDGKEEVMDWACVEGCPVKELDQQSGNRKTTWVSASHKNNRRGDFLGALGHPKDQGYNDEGGASRFFKQFKGS